MAIADFVVLVAVSGLTSLGLLGWAVRALLRAGGEGQHPTSTH